MAFILCLRQIANTRERSVNTTRVINALAEPEQTSVTAHKGTMRFFFFLFFFKSQSLGLGQKNVRPARTSTVLSSSNDKSKTEDAGESRRKGRTLDTVESFWVWRALIYPLWYCKISYNYRKRTATTEPLENLEGTGVEKTHHFLSRTPGRSSPTGYHPYHHGTGGAKKALLSGAEWAWDSHWWDNSTVHTPT